MVVGVSRRGYDRKSETLCHSLLGVVVGGLVIGRALVVLVLELVAAYILVHHALQSSHLRTL